MKSGKKICVVIFIRKGTIHIVDTTVRKIVTITLRPAVHVKGCARETVHPQSPYTHMFSQTNL